MVRGKLSLVNENLDWLQCWGFVRVVDFFVFGGAGLGGGCGVAG